MQVDFYHLTGAPVERVLPRIAERLLAEGGRLLVVADDDALALRIDRGLWNYRPDAFLPHARAGQDGDPNEPVLIAASIDAVNGARNVALADGQWRTAALDFERTFLLFSDEHIEEARAAWRSLGEKEGLERRFWKQDEAGRWSRMA